MKTPPKKSLKPLNLLELLRAIRKRPAMYLSQQPQNGYSIWQLTTFITGFQSGSIGRKPHQEGDLILDAFTFWVCARFGVAGGAMGWAGHIWRHCGEDNEAAFHRFFELLEEYVKERERLGSEAIKNRFMQMMNKIRE